MTITGWISRIGFLSPWKIGSHAKLGTSSCCRHGPGGGQPQWSRSPGLSSGQPGGPERRQLDRGVRHDAASRAGSPGSSGASTCHGRWRPGSSSGSAGWSRWRSSPRREALEDAGLVPTRLDLATRREIGVMLGTGGGGAEFIEAMYAHYYSGHARAGQRLRPARRARTATARRRSRSGSASAGRRTSSRPGARRAPTPSATPSAASGTASRPSS